MENKLHILLIEDSESDADLLIRHLKKENFDFSYARVWNKNSFLEALSKKCPDLIIADQSLPQFSGMEAFQLIKKSNSFIPFILITGSISEKLIAEYTKEGIEDYIMKDNLLRLSSAIKSAIEKKNIERRHKQLEITYEDLYFSMPQEVYIINAEGIVININRRGKLADDISATDLIKEHYSVSPLLKNIIEEGPNNSILNQLNEDATFSKKATFKFEKIDGTFFYGEAIISAIIMSDKIHLQISLNDVTAAKNAELNLAKEVRSTKKYQSMLLSSQINPHFTFNALNSVQYFILLKEDVESALNFVAEFSHLMRNTLSNSRSEFIPISDEIAFLEIYLKLEQKRFEQKFDFTIVVDNGIISDDLFIPPMIVQPYLENAVIHGIANSERKGKIIVQFSKKEDLISCTIKDNGVGRDKAKQFRNLRNQEKKHESMGINITETRIKLLNELYGSTFFVNIQDLKSKSNDPLGTEVTIVIPKLTIEAVDEVVCR